MFSAEVALAAVFDGDDARECGLEAGGGRSGDRMQTSCWYSGARLEAGRNGLRGGRQGDVIHEVSILIGLGGGDRAGRAPSNVSTMMILPPQQGQRRAGETSSAGLSALREGWGATSAAASNCRTRSMLSARIAPANRP